MNPVAVFYKCQFVLPCGSFLQVLWIDSTRGPFVPTSRSVVGWKFSSRSSWWYPGRIAKMSRWRSKFNGIVNFTYEKLYDLFTVRNKIRKTSQLGIKYGKWTNSRFISTLFQNSFKTAFIMPFGSFIILGLQEWGW